MHGCAFTNACVMPGPLVRLEGTDRQFCGMHMRLVELTLAANSLAAVATLPRRSFAQPARRRWETFEGIAQDMG